MVEQKIVLLSTILLLMEQNLSHSRKSLVHSNHTGWGPQGLDVPDLQHILYDQGKCWAHSSLTSVRPNFSGS